MGGKREVGISATRYCERKKNKAFAKLEKKGPPT